MIDGIFNFLNFMTIIMVGWYVWRRFLARAVRQQRTVEQLHHESLLRRREELHKQEHGLHVSVERQELEYQRLLEQMHHWRERVSEDARNQQQRCDEITLAVKQRRMQQEHDLRVMAIHAQVIPQTVQEVKKRLQQHFAQPDAAHEYLKQVASQLLHSEADTVKRGKQ